MVRQLTQRAVAYNSKLHKPIRTNRVGPVPKSPLSTKSFHAKHSRVLLDGLPGTPNRRSLKGKRPVLPTIVEEDEEDAIVHTHFRHDLRRELNLLNDLKETADDDMEWDEENTLVAMLRDDHSEHSDTEDLVALADRLKAPMSAQSQQLKRYMAETIVPAIQQVKKVHDTLEEKVDMAYGTGLLSFDDVCKRVETMAIRTEDEIRTEYIDSKKAADSVLAQLMDAYMQRSALWSQLEGDLAECASRAKRFIEALPDEVDNTISRLERKRKDMEKNSNSAMSKQKILKDLFQQLR